ncbi:vegetative cell wall protein gp1-like [Corvus kubaryi]|uniref:vegetative cell wall protein gp1-like n=1 Tax=Corvus kubaryi TaxID=68294 RepID=UPI001C05538C|nr:vegetative cell wall protein gp1-like [Corvus kubaryi]
MSPGRYFRAPYRGLSQRSTNISYMAPSSPAASPNSAPGIAPSRPSPTSTWASSTSSTRPAWRCTAEDIPPSSCPAIRPWTPSSTPPTPTATLCPASSPPPTRRSTPGSPALTAPSADRHRDAQLPAWPPDRRDSRERARQHFADTGLGDSSRTTDGMVPPRRAQRDTGGVPPCLWLCGSFSFLPPCFPLPSPLCLPHTDPSSAGS